MALTGKAKTDYQREYMKKRRSNARLLDPDCLVSASVRPEQLDPVRPEPTLTRKKYQDVIDEIVRPQSHSPMMVGYVPPKEEENK